MPRIVIGANIAKKKFDVASLSDGKYKHKAFTNDEQGFALFVGWLTSLFGDDKPLVCMEATGAYSILLADFMVGQGLARVGVCNPDPNVSSHFVISQTLRTGLQIPFGIGNQKTCF